LLKTRIGIVQIEEKILVYSLKMRLVEDLVIGRGAFETSEIGAKNTHNFTANLVALIVEPFDELDVEFMQLVDAQMSRESRRGEQSREDFAGVETRRFLVVVET
jgi:hypothetical protein